MPGEEIRSPSHAARDHAGGLPLLIDPLIRGLAASAWSRTTPLPALPVPPSLGPVPGRANRVTAMNLAPLPEASAVVIRALEIGQRVEREEVDRETALIIYRGVREACAASGPTVVGSGFAVIEARAAALEESAARDREGTR